MRNIVELVRDDSSLITSYLKLYLIAQIIKMATLDNLE
jgi:hypothetical protein